jgi:hypothetical protein
MNHRRLGKVKDVGNMEKELLLDLTAPLWDAEVVVPDLGVPVLLHNCKKRPDRRLIDDPGNVDIPNAAILCSCHIFVPRVGDRDIADFLGFDATKVSVEDANVKRGDWCLSDIKWICQ